MPTSSGGCRRLIRVVLAACLAATAPATTAYDNGSYDPEGRSLALWKEGAGLHLEGDYEGAANRYRDALSHYPTARVHTYLAWSLSRLGRHEESVAHCREAMTLDPGYPNAYNDLGSYLIALGRPGEAVPWLLRATRMPGYCCPHYAWYHLGRAYLMQARIDEAGDAFRKALALRPMYHPARYFLARIRGSGLRGL